MALNISIYTILQIFIIATFTQCAQIPPTLRPKHLTKEPSIKIQCIAGNMLITIKDPPPNGEGSFSGMIYPKGLPKNSTCLSEFRNYHGILKYKLPLRSCNTMPQETDDGGIEFFNTIVLQPHLKLVTDLGRGYHVRCRYKSREAASKGTINDSNNDNGSASPQAFTSDESSVDRREHGRSLNFKASNSNEIEVTMPICHMKIYSGETIAENVKIGDPLKIIINIDKQDIYGLHVTDCSVRDGLGWSEQKLINSKGCTLDGEIMGQFDYSSDRQKATVSFPAHKFPYTAAVYYQCNVKLCELKTPECQKAPACNLKRARRDTDDDKDDDGHPAVIEVYSGLYVNENAEIIEGGDNSVYKEPTPDGNICISQHKFAIAIAIAGLILMLTVIAAVLIIMTRRRGKTISNSGSSIYSGPYTNTAFSHSS